ncbi:MAG: ParB/RepB/Spo0J family partition protein [Lachnospiraceae bacterium]|nr:ParB/RepB/Spo0J family partition protein [Lachnospiraceae bacterium]
MAAKAKPKGLGKGLGSLLGDVADITRVTASPVTEEDLKTEQTVKIRLVEPNREQPRKAFDEESLRELADSIALHGVIQPLIVRKKDEHYEIIAGERRWRAAKLAGLKEIPVIVKDYTEEEIAEISLIENIQRSDLNPIEEAEAYEKLIRGYGLTQEALAERVSKNRTVIANALRLLKLPEDVRTMLEQGILSTGHAKAILGAETETLQSEIAKSVVEKGLSVRDTETLVKNAGKPKKGPKAPKKLRNTAEYEKVEQDLKAKLGTKVSIDRRADNAGRIIIDFYSLDDIERILKHIQ